MTILLAIIDSIILSSLALAEPVNKLNFERLIRSSDVICVGSVATIDRKGTVNQTIGGRKFTFDRNIAKIRCLRILKGGVARGAVLDLEFVSSAKYFSLSPPLAKTDTCMLFLKLKGKIYEFADRHYGRQVAAARGFTPTGKSVVDKIEGEFLHCVEHGDYVVSLQSLDRLWSLKSKKLISYESKILSSVSDDRVREAIRGTVTAIRIAGGDVKALEDVKTLAFPETRGFISWQAAILTAISKVRNEKAVETTNELMLHNNSVVRRAAMRALQHIANESSIPYLIVGLQDSNVDTSYGCYRTLMLLTNNRGGPPIPEYREKRQLYVAALMKAVSQWLKDREEELRELQDPDK